MKAFLHGAFVIARRDYRETVLSFSFLAFLLGPCLMLGASLLAARLSAKEDLKSMRPVVALVANEETASPLREANLDLQYRSASSTWPVLKRIDPERDSYAQVQRLLDSQRDGMDAVLINYPLRPRLLGSETQVTLLSGQMEMAIEQAKLPGLLKSHSLPPFLARLEIEVVEGSDVGAGTGRLLMARTLQALMFFLIFMQGGLLLSALNDEKKSRIIDTLLTAMPVDALLLGKVLAMLATSLTFVVCWAGMGSLGYVLLAKTTNFIVTPQMGWPLFVGLTGAYLLLGYLAYGAVLIGLAGFAENSRQIQLISLPLSCLQVLLFMGASVALSQPDTTLAMLVETFPLGTPIAMVGHAAMEAELWPHAFALLWMFGWVLILFQIAAGLFKRGVLK